MSQVIFWMHTTPVPMQLQMANGSNALQLCMHNFSFFFGFSRIFEEV